MAEFLEAFFLPLQLLYITCSTQPSLPLFAVDRQQLFTTGNKYFLLFRLSRLETLWEKVRFWTKSRGRVSLCHHHRAFSGASKLKPGSSALGVIETASLITWLASNHALFVVLHS